MKNPCGKTVSTVGVEKEKPSIFDSMGFGIAMLALIVGLASFIKKGK